MIPPTEVPLEDLVSFPRAAKLLPYRHDSPTSVATINRWALKGCRGVKLRWVQLGASRYTTRLWLAEFVAELTTARGATTPRTSDRREHDIARAERELDDAGI